MPSTGDEPTTQTPETGDAASGATIAASLATAPDATESFAPPAEIVRNSPEYQELQRQNRALAREAGALRAEAERRRQQEESQRAAAEAERAAVIQQEMRSALGDQAPAFAEYAQLLNTDPVAAARKWNELMSAQSTFSEETASTTAPAYDEEPEVTEPIRPVAPVAPQRGVSASTPLGQTQQQSRDELAQQLDEAVSKVVEQNQSLTQRARVTEKIRATAMGQFLQSQYLKTMGERPDLDLNQRRR